MQQQGNTGWYVLGGIALLMVIGHSIGKSTSVHTGTLPPADSGAPDTASAPEIIITSTGK